MQQAEIAVVVSIEDRRRTTVTVWVDGRRLVDGLAQVVVVDDGLGWTRAEWVADRARIEQNTNLCEGARAQALALHDAADGSEFIDDHEEVG